MSTLIYNERSWAIDLTSKINQYAQTRKRAIVRAGGELTLKAKNQNSLFPDVILYGDEAASRVRHGWELKLPDTPITDKEFIDNARKKAIRFGVNSFLLWNVNKAVLYSSTDGTTFTLFHQWDELSINSRAEVKENEKLWTDYLYQILDDLNDFFENGSLRSASIKEVLDENFIVSILEEYIGVCSDSIKSHVKKAASLNAKIQWWWANNAPEYGMKPNKPIDYELLARIVLTNWINRFLFSHYLKRFNSGAKTIEDIDNSTTVEEALVIFGKITQECNFLQIFRPEIATGHIGEETWSALREVNSFLTSLNLDELPQEILHEVIEQILVASRRKVAGQYSTPSNLAQLLVSISTENREGHVIDPCCGTGTIARAAYDLKRKVGYSIDETLETLWASDKFQFPLQLCTLSLADPQAMGKVTRIFREDVFSLNEGFNVNFIDPNNGDEIAETIPLMDTVVSNLPFVRFEDLKKTNPDITTVISNNTDFKLSNKSDLLALVIMHLRHLVNNGGRIGIIVSNSWLSSDWGKLFREALESQFTIKAVVTSGKGRWFNNADVVTNIIVLEKTNPTEESSTKFITTLKKVDEWTEENIDEITRDNLIINETHNSDIAKYTVYKRGEIEEINQIVTGWALLFSDVKWLSTIKNTFVKASNLFEVKRGERRGWNALFYPAQGHGIEDEFIRPVLRTARNIDTYIANGESKAFCCSKSIDELTQENKNGALNWINNFVNGTNDKGEPLTESLKRAGHYWYEMKAETQADLVLGMNPSDRIFIAKMSERGFVDQRLIRFSAKNESTDIELCHALLNSILGLLMIEASGFGRGLGALDLNATKISKGFYMLNPDLLSEEAANTIKTLFNNIKNRNVEPIRTEINRADRITFDKAVLTAFDIADYEEAIRTSLTDIYNIRTSVFDN